MTKKNYPTLADMKTANPGFFNKVNKSFFGDQKYRAYHGYLIVEAITSHSNGTKSKRIAIYRFAPELNATDPFFHVTISPDSRNIDTVKKLISEYEKNEWPARVAQIAPELHRQLISKERTS